MHPLARLALVFVGGTCGTALRAALLLLPHDSGALTEAIALTAINLVGAFLLGLLLGRVRIATPRADAARALLGTGALGGFTSYSALVLFTLPAGGDPVIGIVLALVSLPIGIAAALLGLRLGGTAPSSPRPASGPA